MDQYYCKERYMCDSDNSGSNKWKDGIEETGSHTKGQKASEAMDKKMAAM